MSDLINRQAAIDAMWELQGRAGSKGELVGISKAWKRIEKLPSAQQRWIPVAERLPEEDDDVLISYRYKEGEGDTSHVDINITSYGDMYFGGRKVAGVKHWRQPFEYFTSNYEVIAWMPLPEPYRRKKNERRYNL